MCRQLSVLSIGFEDFPNIAVGHQLSITQPNSLVAKLLNDRIRMLQIAPNALARKDKDIDKDGVYVRPVGFRLIEGHSQLDP